MQRDSGSDQALDLREYLGVLSYRKWTIALVTLLVVGSALAFSLRQTPIYKSQAEVLVRPSAVAAGVAPTAPNLSTERALVHSAAVASIVGQHLAFTGPVTDLLGPLEASVETNTEILTITYSDPDPARAQRLAQAFADGYIEFSKQQTQAQIDAQSAPILRSIDQLKTDIASLERRMAATTNPQRRSALSAERDSDIAGLGVLKQDLEKLGSLSTAQGGGQIVQSANLPGTPSSPNYRRNLALALVVGLCLAVGLAFLRERLDDRLRGRPDFEIQIQAPVLAAVPKVKGWNNRSKTELVTLTSPRSAPAEAYRTLRTNLQFIARHDDFRVLVVTSAAAGEGKTTTVANLAVALAQAGTKVVAVSCDLRKPRLEAFFGLDYKSGVTTILIGDIDVNEAILRPDVPNLRILASGEVPPNPSELLASVEFEKMLSELRGAADLVIVDASPILPVTDAIEIATRADGVILVSDPAVATRGMVAQAREQLEQVGANLVGGIMNNLRPTRYSYYPYYGGSYRQEPPRDGDGRAAQ